MKEAQRIQGLKRNGARLFWVSALFNFSTFATFSTAYYVQRGLTLSQVLYTAVVWAVVGLVSETPSSYLADRWGRRPTILAGVALSAAAYLMLLVASGTWPIWIFFALSALAYACISGTDEDLVYDSKLELGEQHETLTSLSRFTSARHLLKIAVPLMAALVVSDLTARQFNALLCLDAATSLAAGFIAWRLVEPRHQRSVINQESHLMARAWQTLRSDPWLRRAVVSRAVLMTAAFALHRPHVQQFLDMGVLPLILGVSWSLFHVVMFVYLQTEHWRRNAGSLEARLNRNNFLVLVAVVVFIALWYWLPNPYLLLLAFLAVQFLEVIRGPKYSELLNRRAASFNRATTMSMANALKSMIDIPFMIVAASLLSRGLIMSWWLVALVALAVVVFLRLPVGPVAPTAERASE